MKSEGCLCENYIYTLNINIDYFLKLYYEFISKKGNKNKTLNQIKESYNMLQELIEDLKIKGEECLTKMKSCSNNHSKDIDEISLKMDQFSDLKEKIENHYNLKIESCNKNNNNENNENNKDNKDNNKNVINICEKDNNKNEFEIIDDIKDNKLTEKQIMEKDRENIIIMKNLIKDKKTKIKENKDKKELIKIENELNEILNHIETELNKNDEQINHIEDNVANGFELIEKGDIELQMAAHSAVYRRKLKYEFGLGALFCAIGTIVPGIGNIVGGAVGALAGYGLHKIDKYRLEQVEKDGKI